LETGTSVILALRRQRQEDGEVKASLGYIARACLKKKEEKQPMTRKKKKKKKKHDFSALAFLPADEIPGNFNELKTYCLKKSSHY
jgi:hypothetical protein